MDGAWSILELSHYRSIDEVKMLGEEAKRTVPRYGLDDARFYFLSQCIMIMCGRRP